jgi:hypothetical protein
MGLDYHGVRLMAYTKTMEPRLDSIAMLGRQSLHTDAAAIAGIFTEFNVPFQEQDLERIVEGGNGYCEPLLNHLGFKTVESFDYSDYENPTHVHDFNQPISSEFHSRYDLVLDGGSLEHIFNFPTALRNVMQMVKPGGIFVTSTPCNNQCGHGFYQFSPELYFSLMRGQNGYELLDLFCHEIGPGKSWHRMIDPSLIKNRVNLVTWNPIMMIVIARRTATGPLPEFQIQQSDYETRWSGGTLGDLPRPTGQLKFSSRAYRFAMRFIPTDLKLLIRQLVAPKSFRPEYFTNLDRDKSSLLKTALAARKTGVEIKRD